MRTTLLTIGGIWAGLIVVILFGWHRGFSAIKRAEAADLTAQNKTARIGMVADLHESTGMVAGDFTLWAYEHRAWAAAGRPMREVTK